MKQYFFSVMLALSVGGCVPDDDAVPQNNPPLNSEEMLNNEEPSSVFLDCDDTDRAAAFSGTIYVDLEDIANSEYDHTPMNQRGGLETATIRLRTESETILGDACADGTFRISEELSSFFVTVEHDGREVVSRNAPKHLLQALEGESINLLVFGDSVPVFGPTPYFPNILKRKLEPWADVNLENIAVSGSTSDQWVPGGTFFESRLRSKLGEADLIVFSLGGNDLSDFAFGLDASNIGEKLAEVPALIDAIEANLSATIAEVKTLNPNADIVWLVYPNYARSTEWKIILTSSFAAAGERFLDDTLKDVRQRMANQDILLLDMFGATADIDLDTVLIDPLHLNEVGHQLWADELFKVLGGVETPAPMMQREWGFSN